jgi:hypothetical protein
VLEVLAGVVDKTASRWVLGLFAAAATVVFGFFALLAIGAGPFESPDSFGLGVAAWVGLAGWWARVFMPSQSFASRPRRKAAVLFALAVGIAAAAYAMTLMSRAIPAFWLLACMVAAGVSMLLGTLRLAQPGPNNSSKPTPLRGAA